MCELQFIKGLKGYHKCCYRTQTVFILTIEAPLRSLHNLRMVVLISKLLKSIVSMLQYISVPSGSLFKFILHNCTAERVKASKVYFKIGENLFNLSYKCSLKLFGSLVQPIKVTYGHVLWTRRLCVTKHFLPYYASFDINSIITKKVFIQT